MARVLIHAKNLPLYFWEEACITAVHIINRVYLRKNTKMTPYEFWFNKKPNVKYFRTFGSICYVCNDRDNLSKFEAKGDKSIFLGYSQNSRALRVFNLRTKSIVESINVVVIDSTIEPVSKDPPVETDLDTNILNDSVLMEHESLPAPTLAVPNWVSKDHPSAEVMGDIRAPVRTRNQLRQVAHMAAFVSLVEPKSVDEALCDSYWIDAM